MIFGGLLPALTGPFGDEIKRRYTQPAAKRFFDAIDARFGNLNSSGDDEPRNDAEVSAFVEEHRTEVREVVQQVIELDRLAVIEVIVRRMFNIAAALGAPFHPENAAYPREPGLGCIALAGSLLSPSYASVVDIRRTSTFLSQWSAEPQRKIEADDPPAIWFEGEPEDDYAMRLWIVELDAGADLDGTVASIWQLLSSEETRPLPGLMGYRLREWANTAPGVLAVHPVRKVLATKIWLSNEPNGLSSEVVDIPNVAGLVAVSRSLAALCAKEDDRLRTERDLLTGIIDDLG